MTVTNKTANLVYLYLLSPLHTGGTTQEGNLLGIARESHTNLPYIPSSTIRGRLRASADRSIRFDLFGNELSTESSDPLTQGAIWIGDGSILWVPVPSLSHGVVWVSCPMLLQRWQRLQGQGFGEISPYSTNLKSGKPVYLKDAILKDENLKKWENWKAFVPPSDQTSGVSRVLVLPDQHCATIVQMSLWRQVKIKLDEHKIVDGGFRYEEAIPPDTIMYFPWGITNQTTGSVKRDAEDKFQDLLQAQEIFQIGGQESLGRGFVQAWLSED